MVEAAADTVNVLPTQRPEATAVPARAGSSR